MSTITLPVFDASKPETPPTANPTTADQRAQHANGNTAFGQAKTDIEALETGKEDVGVAAVLVTAHDGDAGAHSGTFDPAGTATAAVAAHETAFSHANLPTTNQKAALDNAPTAPTAGNPFATVADVGGSGEANTSSNAGAGAQLALAKAGVDLPFRSLVSGDASVTFTQNATELDIRSTGAGGGESNTQTNQGAGIELGLTKNGVDLPLRTLDTGQFETNGNQVRIPTGVFAPNAHVGATGAAHGNATTGAAGFMAGADKTKLDGIAAGAEANTQSNQGGGIELGLTKSVFDLPLRTLDTGQFETNGNQVRIRADGITSNELAPDSVGTSEIATNAVTGSEIANNAVGTNEIIAGAVTPSRTTDIPDINRNDMPTGGISFAVVAALPSTPDANTIYFLTG